ncbi:coagulation factor XIII B chain isoform X2 [Xenopus laevis]|uniref:Coagulation factor XIII B chain isoform X2 n=1 Tax=Xenopus laevis TaxID=8355 RepID=A0A8J1MXP5_XENLA|nr:coagulation factor XIII B chain isoform X2 [Xenopus laevis]
MSVYKFCLLLLCHCFCFAQEQGQSCGPSPMVQFGDTLVPREATNKHGTVMTYRCPEYYVLEGNKEVMCRNGKWDDPPICIEPCTALERELKANNIRLKWISDKKLYSRHNEWMEFACLDGYEISDEKLLRKQCIRSVISYPKCTKIGQGQSCGPPPVIQFGDTLETREPTNKHGTVMTYKCPDYYILEGSKKVVCRNGKWDDPPICIEPCTALERDMTANNIQLKWMPGKKLYIRHNEWIGFVCLNGYEISDEKLLRIQCNRSVLPYPKCTKIGNCTSPVTITNGNIIIVPQDGKSFSSGTSLKVECSEGYAPGGRPFITCDNSTWINVPRCVRQCLVSLQELETYNLKLESATDLDGIYILGDTLNIQCKPGYSSEQNAPLMGICTNGNFKYPQCSTGSSCTISINDLGENKLELLRPIGANKKYPHGTQFHFKCESNYVLPPQKLRTAICDNGNIDYPRCYSLNSCRIFQEQLDENELELDSKDEDLVYFEDGELIKFKCKAGLISTTGTVGLCAKKRITYPRCTEPRSCTISINDVKENNIELLRPKDTNKEYTHGTQFHFKCKTSYVLPPQKQLNAICDNGNVNYPRCYSLNRCRISQEELDENELELDSKDEDSVYFEDGELIHFKCKAGFTGTTGTVGLCANTQITYPRCTES